MKKILVLTAVASTVMLLFANVSMATFINPVSGDGSGKSLQDVLNGLVVSPPGPLLDASGVVNDALANDAYWKIQASGGAVSTFIIQITGYVPAGFENAGIFDAANPANRVQVFASGALQGTQVTVSIDATGQVYLDHVLKGTFNSGGVFGFYIDVNGGTTYPANTWFSDDSLNADQNDHMVAFQGNGKTIQILPWGPGTFSQDEYIFAFEDLGWTNIDPNSDPPTWGPYQGQLSDRDYNDTVFLVESIQPIPEPATMLLLGSGLLGLGVVARKKFKK